MQVEVLDDGRLQGRVAERHVLHVDAAGQLVAAETQGLLARIARHGLFRDVDLVAHDVLYALGLGLHLLNGLTQPDKLHDRRHERREKTREREHHTWRHLA